LHISCPQIEAEAFIRDRILSAFEADLQFQEDKMDQRATVILGM
jgi:hypothetical protein